MPIFPFWSGGGNSFTWSGEHWAEPHLFCIFPHHPWVEEVPLHFCRGHFRINNIGGWIGQTDWWKFVYDWGWNVMVEAAQDSDLR